MRTYVVVFERKDEITYEARVIVEARSEGEAKKLAKELYDTGLIDDKQWGEINRDYGDAVVVDVECRRENSHPWI